MNNVVSGNARDVVQAGYIGHLSVGGAGGGPLQLALPALDTVESLLSFANTTVEYVGRAKELQELTGFLAAEPSFSWWVWTGPAGMGKSRLAVEFCRSASESGWHAGFLREGDQTSLDALHTLQPTLIVVDYAAQRSKWLSDALALLSRQHHEFPIRVLILERRAAGEWWSTTQRANRMEESYRVTAAMYANPRPMVGLDRIDARTLVRSMTTRLDTGPLAAGQVEHIVDRAENMDPDLRPLFVQVATIDRLNQDETRTGRDDMLRRVVARKIAWLDSRVDSPSSAARAHNLRLFATAIGGLTVEEFEALHLHSESLKTLLPEVFQLLGPSVTADVLVDGVRPDIVGELFVLDRLDAEPTVVLASTRLLDYAARVRPEAYRGFLERAVMDHTDHPRLLDLLKTGNDGKSALSDLEPAVAVMQLLGRSKHTVIDWVFGRIDATIAAGLVDRTCRLITTAHFKFANLVRVENDIQRAHDLYTEALIDCDPTWSEYDSILNNRGITLCELGQVEAATADYSAVIGSMSASAEIRACALNNRADILEKQGDIGAAIADRSSVLSLSGTSYDRRYIALAGRALAHRRQGDSDSARQDIAGILDAKDIAIEQKMQARLIRAEWALEDGDPTRAQKDLDEIVASYRNFENVETKANELQTLATTTAADVAPATTSE
ncbi:hypothetical protein [Umezawaea sp. Da 62-37]|uniref:hypothetical protein n=1 Tax=Umezawaea sp. Da 62-37 TaxID=3075927 RepID=UPI0028F6DDED|nr:hypothetical protein [Umezawaea sp. Da 62-37]WNV84864.1 hypothetical protein RM788_43015 [Umezawaea sp. Da 62-37]